MVRKKIKKSAKRVFGKVRSVKTRLRLEKTLTILVIILLALIVLLNISAQSREASSKIQLKGKVTFLDSDIPGFVMSNQEICMSNGKPIVILFGTSWDKWTKSEIPVFESATEEFSDRIVIEKYLMDVDDVPVDRVELFNQFDEAKTYPATIVGCKYMKIGGSINVDDNSQKLKSVIEKVLHSY